MAAIQAVASRPNDNTVRLTWSSVTEADTCAASSELDGYGDRSIHVSSSAWGGATIALKGSNEDACANPEPLTDPQAVAIALSSGSATHVKQITECTHYVQPVTTGGTNSSVKITILARRGK